MTATSTEAASKDAHAHPHLVDVSLEVTNDAGETQTTVLTIPRGATDVPVLKEELGVPNAVQLWVIQKNGKRKPLADHEKHHVKEGDRYQAIVKGGIS